MRTPVSRRCLRVALNTLVLACSIGVVACSTSTGSRGGAATRPASVTGGNGPTRGSTIPTITAMTCAAPYPRAPVTAATVFCADPRSLTAAPVIRIVDGDTLHVELNGRDETVRLYGINAAERGQPCSGEATERLAALAGQEVRLRADARERDRYGRLLRYVYTDDGLSIDAELVDEGLAHAWRDDGDLRFAIIALETAAATAHRGCIAPE